MTVSSKKKKRGHEKIDPRIPEGYVCYSYSEDGKKIMCPYHKIVQDRKWQKDAPSCAPGMGVCLKFNVTDKEYGAFGLLWDEVKTGPCWGLIERS